MDQDLDMLENQKGGMRDCSVGIGERESLYDLESSLHPRLVRDVPEGPEAGQFLNDHKIFFATRSSSGTWPHPH